MSKKAGLKTKIRTKIRKSDVIRIITGKEKGKEGKVLHVLLSKEAVLVDRLNLLKRATRPSEQQPQGGIIEREGKIHISNVMLVCPNCNAGTRIGIEILADGKKMRKCKRCGEVLDKDV